MRSSSQKQGNDVKIAERVVTADQLSFLGPGDPGTLLLVALPLASAAMIAAQARKAGYSPQIANAIDDLVCPRTYVSPGTIVLNIDVVGWTNALELLRARAPAARIVAATQFASVVNVAAAARRGASAVVVCPSSFKTIVSAEAEEARVPPTAMSLDRAIWEYLMQAVLEAGSISHAARRLRLDRTSLKRMLRKVPPFR